jgi:hypothetical protein
VFWDKSICAKNTQQCRSPKDVLICVDVGQTAHGQEFKMRRSALPEAAHRKAEARKRETSASSFGSGSMTKVAQEPGAHACGLFPRQRQEKGGGEGRQEQQFLAAGPGAETRALEAHFTFVEAPGSFTIPPTSVGEDNAPGLLLRPNLFGGEEIPGTAAFALSRHHQPEGYGTIGMTDRKGEHSRLQMPMQMLIPDLPLAPGPFALGNLPGFACSSLLINEVRSLWPAHHQPLLESEAQVQPGFGGIPSIKDMDHAPAEGGHTVEHQSGFELAFALGMRTTRAPPAHGRQGGWSRARRNTDQHESESIKL